MKSGHEVEKETVELETVQCMLTVMETWLNHISNFVQPFFRLPCGSAVKNPPAIFFIPFNLGDFQAHILEISFMEARS